MRRRSEWASTSVLARAAGATTNTAYVTLRRLEREGLVRRDSKIPGQTYWLSLE